MTVFDAINNRKSIRRYKADSVSEADLKKVLEAGILAPTAKNMQKFKVMAITDPSLNKKMRKACGGQNMIGQAPVSLVVLSNGSRMMPIGLDAGIIDASIVLSFMILQATELGLATCWLGNVDTAKLREVLDIPEEYDVIAVTPLGYANEDGLKRTRKKFEDLVAFNSL